MILSEFSRLGAEVAFTNSTFQKRDERIKNTKIEIPPLRRGRNLSSAKLGTTIQ